MTITKGETVVSIGTKKGLFLAHSRDRKRWKIEKPSFEGVSVYHARLDPRDGKTTYAAIESMHWGPTVARSTNFGGKWVQPKKGPHYAKDTGLSVSRVWHVEPGFDGELYAGVEPAGLFRSDDGGDTWRSIDGLNTRKDRKDWPPGGGGLCAHTILPYPGEPKRMIVGVSSAGIFGTNDGGDNWRLMNDGIRNGANPEGKTHEETLGCCPHKIVRDARDPAQLYMQNHWGVYKRRRGESKWTAIDAKLPSQFGFPMLAHPTDAKTFYNVPLVGDYNRVTPGAMAVWRTRDAGKSWTKLTKGLPQKDAYFTILREGLATDGADPTGIYVGTTTGQLFASRDEGASWTTIADTLPPIFSVEAGIAGGK
ncbi:MAG: WD40/YVTN/BNR-like repeat-containing protein [Thermoplasmatota archaeon]